MYRILLAHPNTEERQHLQQLLEQAYYYIVGSTNNGNECVRLAQTQHPDILICDWNLYGLNGKALLQALPSKLPVMMLSYTSWQAALSTTTILVAPYTKQALLQQLASLVAKSHAR